MLPIGAKAPDFNLNDTHGTPVKLSDFKGKNNVVLYFYPKDDTPGCTVEAKAFSTAKSSYDKLDTIVLGVSKDTEVSHQKFCNKYSLTVTLLADPDHKIIDRYGAWQIKKLYGKESMGTVRSTYLIDKNGIISQVWPKVRPAGHEIEVLKAVKTLS